MLPFTYFPSIHTNTKSAIFFPFQYQGAYPVCGAILLHDDDRMPHSLQLLPKGLSQRQGNPPGWLYDWNRRRLHDAAVGVLGCLTLGRFDDDDVGF